MKLRKERTVRIIEKITKEMINGIRLAEKPIDDQMIQKIKETKFRIVDGDSSTKISSEEETRKENVEDESKNLENIAITVKDVVL